MKKFVYAAVICAVALSACTTPFKKAKDGTEYKVISNKNGKKILVGEIMEFNGIVRYKDSVLGSSYEDGMPQYGRYDTAQFPSPYKEAFVNLHVGDSIVFRMSTDSILKTGQAPPFMKKGSFVYRCFKMENAYTTEQQADSAQKTHIKIAQEKANQKQLKQVEKDLAENKAQIEKDSKLIDEYLAKNNIKATKTKWGTYVAVQTEGTGPALTFKDVASVNYTGRTFDSSKVFDSNVDPKFKHVTPYEVPVGQYSGIIVGWPDALKEMKKGTKATVYIPSSLAYGKNGRAPEIKPDQILVFDMEVLNVISQEDMAVKQAEEEKQMKAAQEKMMDSLKNANPRVKAEMEKKGK